MTHYIFYMQLKRILDKKTIKNFPSYDSYSVFAQGHDFFIYHDFFKIFNQRRLNKNVELSKQLQEFQFQKFVYTYLKTAQSMDLLGDEQVRLFIEAGYIGHHLLDAYVHPLIIYYTGDHVRDTKNKTWYHGIAENLLDIHMMQKNLSVDPFTFPVQNDFAFSEKDMSAGLIKVLDSSINEVYGCPDGGKIIARACAQMSLFMRVFKYDPTGLKKRFFDRIDPVFKGTSSFSYHRKNIDLDYVLNEQHHVWHNPMNGDIKSKESFWDLYEKALWKCKTIIEQIETLCCNNRICFEEICTVIPDIASTHGLSCGRTIQINCTAAQTCGICKEIPDQFSPRHS